MKHYARLDHAAVAACAVTQIIADKKLKPSEWKFHTEQLLRDEFAGNERQIATDREVHDDA
jgi:hypothetical protein